MHQSILGTSLYVEDTGGPGAPVAFSHGLLLSCRMFDAQVAALRGMHRCIAWDHRGQGRSAPASTPVVSIDQCADDAIALLERLATGPVHFVGLSMGGFVGMRVAARRPDLVRSLTLLDTSADPEPAENLPRYRLLTTIVRYVGPRPVSGAVMKILFGRSWLADPAYADARAQWRRHLGGNRRAIVRAVEGVLRREGAMDLLPAIRCPVTVAVGEEDVATVPAKAEAIARVVPGAVLVRIPRAGHSSSIEAPEAVTEAIRGTIARADAR